MVTYGQTLDWVPPTHGRPSVPIQARILAENTARNQGSRTDVSKWGESGIFGTE